jgi:hypothetical protein
MISLASPRTIASKIASAHNRGECRCCHRPLDPNGVFTFGTSGSDPRWYPTLERAERETTGPRYILPARDTPISREDAEAFIEKVRADLEQHVEHVETDRQERRVKREHRESETGFAHGCNCFTCGRFKTEPAQICDYCGDDPVQHNGDRHEFNRAYGAIA